MVTLPNYHVKQIYKLDI